ncbi:MAG TPA: hypothetical protein VL614_05215 [Acetobacteraceae bacterium]|jgi:hypothetical protein|nr:hypothetical protein [Acetobacteraceae bacterium]
MMRATPAPRPGRADCSELVLSDRLITLAEDADRAGYTDTAEMLLKLACSVFDEAPRKLH